MNIASYVELLGILFLFHMDGQKFSERRFIWTILQTVAISEITYFEWSEIFSISEAVVAMITVAAISIVSLISKVLVAATAISNQWTAETLWHEIVWIHFVGATIARSIESIISIVIVLWEVVAAWIFVRMKWTMLLLLLLLSSTIIPIVCVLRRWIHWH